MNLYKFFFSAKKALKIEHDIIKSRTMGQASHIAAQTATKSDLKPAMKRPPTTMQTARRLINTHLGTKSRISKEEQEKEKELLRQAKGMLSNCLCMTKELTHSVFYNSKLTCFLF